MKTSDDAVHWMQIRLAWGKIYANTCVGPQGWAVLSPKQVNEAKALLRPVDLP